MPAYFVSHENEFAIGQPRLEETALIRKRKLLDIREEIVWKLAETYRLMFWIGFSPLLTKEGMLR